MPWQFHHKCNISDEAYRDFGMAAVVKAGVPYTHIKCDTQNGGCGEEMLMVGHDIFDAAIPSSEAGIVMPKGFLVPVARRGLT